MKTLVFNFLFSILCVVLSSSLASAQLEQPILHFGVGVGNQLATSGADGGIPPVVASLDYPISEAITVGGYVGYTGFNQPVFGDIKYKYSYIIVGARGTYHLDLGPEKLDPYGGLMLGYNIVNSKLEGGTLPFGAGNATGSGVGLSAFVGANYNLTEKVGAFAELGYGIAWLTLGVSMNL